MTCNNEWTVRFPDVPGEGGPFEIRPFGMDFKHSRGEYAYANAKFPTEVGAMMKPHTRYADGKLGVKTAVEVLYNGKLIHSLYFKPDFARYGDQYTHLEFHDLRESMDSGVVDKQWSSVKLKDAYEYVFSKRTNTDLIKDIKFAVPEEIQTELMGEASLEPDDGGLFYTDFSIKELEGIGGELNRYLYPFKKQAIEANATQKLVDSYYAIDINKECPEKAIWILNKKFNVRTWVDKSRRLWVGYPEALQPPQTHIAAPNDERVWRYNGDSVNIRHPREPVQQVTVEGGWVDEPGAGGVDDIVSWFNPSDGRGLGDVKATGVAYRTDINYGESLAYKNTKAKRDALPGLAEAAMRELMKQGHSGTVEINTDLSGDFTALEYVSPGDFLRMVPNDNHFENPTATSGQVGDEPDDLGGCNSFVNNELYFIKEVQHHVEGSHWSLTLDVGMYPDVLDENMGSVMRYFDPRSEEYLTEEEVFDGDWIEGI